MNLGQTDSSALRAKLALRRHLQRKYHRQAAGVYALIAVWFLAVCGWPAVAQQRWIHGKPRPKDDRTPIYDPRTREITYPASTAEPDARPVCPWCRRQHETPPGR